jgi:hypothetical protein
VLRTIIGNFGKELGVEMDFQGTKRLVNEKGSNKIKLSRPCGDFSSYYLQPFSFL